MNKPTIGVIFGSRSAEHDVSIVTALASIIKPLELSKQYNVVAIYISKEGKWYSSPLLKDISLFSSGKIDEFLKKHQPVAIQFDNGMKFIEPGLRNKVITIDIAFPATHGTHGEDGELMGLLELANIPYVGCDMPSSVLAMDKVLAKIMAASQGILVTKFEHFTKTQFETNRSEWLRTISETLKYPLFVKPAHLGSSIGITRVTNQEELENAIEVALHYDDSALAEEAVTNLAEVTLPIMGNAELTPSLLEQPLTKSEDFFDFETKYMQGGKKGKNADNGDAGAQGYSRIPAEVSEDLYERAIETGLAVYKALGCSGIARVDMLIDEKSQQVYFNEVNPLPGSLYSHNWNKSGISNIALVTKLVQLAVERYEEKQELTTIFSTNYLKQF